MDVKDHVALHAKLAATEYALRKAIDCGAVCGAVFGHQCQACLRTMLYRESARAAYAVQRVEGLEHTLAMARREIDDLIRLVDTMRRAQERNEQMAMVLNRKSGSFRFWNLF